MAISGLALAPAAASAGQVGVTVSIQGSGSTSVVEGSLEDGATGTCNWLSNKDDRVTNSCTRFRNEETLEAWVWLKATASNVPAGHWKFVRWEGCDETRGTGVTQECAVHSEWNTGVERKPKAVFDDEKAPTVSAVTETFSTAIEKQVNWSFTTDEGQLQCRFDAESTFTNCSPGNKLYASEGEKTLEIQAVDASGQVSTSTSRKIWVLDTAITGGPGQGTTTANRSPTFTYGTGSGDGFMCSLNSTVAYTACAGGSKSFNGLADGTYTFRVYATRNGGWYDRIPAVRTFTIDGAPDTSLVPPVGPAAEFFPVEGAFTTFTTATFAFTSTEPGSAFECRVDPQPFAPCTLPFALTGLTTGAKKFQVRAKDPAGHYDESPAERNWTVSVDNDGDTYTAPSDCDDGNKAINPGATEILDDGVDQNCDGDPGTNFDRDADASPRPADCDDANPGINPGAREVLDDGVDQNCDGDPGVNLDRDGDGSKRPADCDDGNAAIRPGNFDVPGNSLDEDCFGGPQPASLKELPAKLGFYFAKPTAKGTTFTTLQLNGLPEGTKIVAKCSKKGCPKPFTKTGAKGKVSIKPWIGKRIPAGAVLTLTATKPGMLGAVKTIKVRKSKRPTWSASCLAPGASKPTACP